MIRQSTLRRMVRQECRGDPDRLRHMSMDECRRALLGVRALTAQTQSSLLPPCPYDYDHEPDE